MPADSVGEESVCRTVADSKFEMTAHISPHHYAKRSNLAGSVHSPGLGCG